MQELLRIHEGLGSKDTIEQFPICPGAYELTVNGKRAFVVCDDEGEEGILREYRQASIEAAMRDIPEVYHDFFEFNDFADYSWQTIYDVYENVDEIVDESGKRYYICSI